METTIKKKYVNLPFAHRQHTHQGHCAKIHGHSWDFEFEFSSGERDSNGFILDFGELRWLREWLENHFDHTLVLAENDPIVAGYEVPLNRYADVQVLPAASCEGIAAYVFKHVDALLWTKTGQRVKLVSVTVWESPQNSATIRSNGT